MKGKGGLNDFELYFERLPSEPAQKRKNKRISILETYITTGPATYFPIVFQLFKGADKGTVLSNVDDRTPMHKLPQANKTLSKNKGKK